TRAFGGGASLGFSISRGCTWTSFTSVVCAAAGRLRAAKANKPARVVQRKKDESKFLRSMVAIGSLERTGEPLEAKAFGLDDRRHATRAINTSMRRMLAQLPAVGAGFLSKIGDKSRIFATYPRWLKMPAGRGSASSTAKLLQSKVSY